jgi:hypothetical protein
MLNNRRLLDSCPDALDPVDLADHGNNLDNGGVEDLVRGLTSNFSCLPRIKKRRFHTPLFFHQSSVLNSS